MKSKQNKVKGLYKRGNVWWITYQVNGKRHFEGVCPDKRTAENVLHKRRVAIAENRDLDIRKIPKITFITSAQEYLKTYAKQDKGSWITDTYYIENLSKFFADKLLAEIKPKMIEDYKRLRLKQVSKSSVRKELSCLSMIFRKAMDWDRVESNPLRKVKYPKQAIHRKRFLTEDEIVTLLSKCSNCIRPMVALAIHTGIRRGELFGLKWKDVSISDQFAYITLLKTKNKEARTVHLNPVARGVIASISKNKNSDFIFCKKNGKPYHDVRKSFKSALEKSGIEDFRWHDLRHSCGSLLAKYGYTAKTIADILGHKDIRETQKYMHFTPDFKAKALDRLAEGLRQHKKCYKNVTMDTLTVPGKVPEKKLFIPQPVINK